MATYLLTWNPNEWDWADLKQSSKSVKLGKPVDIEWSCGNTKKIKEGDRVFMLIQGQGVDPKGICASGTVIQGSFEGYNWKQNLSQFIRFRFDTLLDPKADQVLPRHLLSEQRFSAGYWDTQRSGISIPDLVADELEKSWIQFSKKSNLAETDEFSAIQREMESAGYFDANNLEDTRSKTTRSIAQRRGQPKFRRQLLDAYGGRCPITGCNAEAALEAAHIMPYRGKDSNHVTNGLLLRADIHTLFDLHLLSIHPDTREIILSPELTTSSYQRAYGNQKLRSPREQSALPDRTALENHYKIFSKKHRQSH
jgi:HNH endonuclease